MGYKNGKCNFSTKSDKEITSSFKIDLDNEGAHSIMGVSYLDNKI